MGPMLTVTFEVHEGARTGKIKVSGLKDKKGKANQKRPPPFTILKKSSDGRGVTGKPR